MSENNPNPLKEINERLVLTPEDVQGAAEFWTQFEIPMPPELKAAVDKFVENPSLETQTEFKLQLTKTIGYSDHEAFNDELFQEITGACKDAAHDITFNKDLEKILSTKE